MKVTMLVDSARKLADDNLKSLQAARERTLEATIKHEQNSRLWWIFFGIFELFSIFSFLLWQPAHNTRAAALPSI